MVFTLDNAWNLLQLFVNARIPKAVRELDLDLTLETRAEEALLEISKLPLMDLAAFPPAVVRVIYEKIVIFMAILATPGVSLSPDFDKCNNELEQLSLLLWGEIRNMKLRELSLFQAPDGAVLQ